MIHVIAFYLFAFVTIASAVFVIMVRNPVVADPEDSMDQVRAIMTDQHVRYLPIVHERKLLGILSFHDIARAALKLANFENKLLKQDNKNWPEESQP